MKPGDLLRRRESGRAYMYRTLERCEYMRDIYPAELLLVIDSGYSDSGVHYYRVLAGSDLGWIRSQNNYEVIQ